jgi:hypothetical protein
MLGRISHCQTPMGRISLILDEDGFIWHEGKKYGNQNANPIFHKAYFY